MFKLESLLADSRKTVEALSAITFGRKLLNRERYATFLHTL